MLFHAFAIAIALSQPACHKDSTPTNTTADLKSRLIAIAREGHLPTLSVFIQSDSDPVRFDYKDKDSRIQPVSQYGIASATKLISSLIVLQYVEQKKIDLDARVNQYIDISSLATISWAGSITVRNLLGHTSGIPDYSHNPSWITGVMAAHPPQSLDDKLHLIPPPDTSFRLGKFSYSNTNYVILQKIIEKVSGRQSSDVFNDFCTRYGLANTTLTRPAGTQQAYFSKVKDQTADVSAWEENYGFEGGAYSTVDDLAKLLKLVFIDKKIITDISLTQMMQWTDMDKFKVNFGYGQSNNYGLGLAQLKVKDHLFIGHSGGSLKYQSFVFIEPATNKEIILLTNCSGQNYNNVFFINLIGQLMDN